MSDDYEIHYKELADRIDQVADLDAFSQAHGVSNIREVFKVMDLFPPNAGQENCRSALRALGFNFADDQSVRISYEKSPLV